MCPSQSFPVSVYYFTLLTFKKLFNPNFCISLMYRKQNNIHVNEQAISGISRYLLNNDTILLEKLITGTQKGKIFTKFSTVVAKICRNTAEILLKVMCF